MNGDGTLSRAATAVYSSDVLTIAQPAAAGAESRSEASSARQFWWVTALVLCAYVVLIAAFSPLYSLEDLPNHLARAVVIEDLLFHHGERFGEAFQVHWLTEPYIIGDCLVVPAVHFFGPKVAAAIWTAFAFVSLPAAVLLYLRTLRVSDMQQMTGLLLAAYLSTDWFFMMGFLEFRVGVAIVLVSLAVADRFRANPSLAMAALYIFLAALGYLTHLSAPVFVIGAVAASGGVRWWFGRTSLATEAMLLLPPLLTLAWHFGIAVNFFQQSGDVASDYYYWGTVSTKLSSLYAEFRRFAGHHDQSLELLFFACIGIAALGRLSRATLAKIDTVALIAVAAAFAGLYVVLPIGYSKAWFVDVRALAIVSLALVLAVLQLPAADRRASISSAAAFLGSMLLALGNLALITAHFAHDAEWTAKYLRVLAHVPAGAYVFPVNAHASDAPYLEAAFWAVTDRGAVMPYLFSGNSGEPTSYFRYRKALYAPSQTWYNEHPEPNIDWPRIGCTYQFLLISRPWDRARIPLNLISVAETDAAELLRISPANCSVRGPRPAAGAR